MTREEEIRKSAFEYIKSDAVKAGEEYTSFGDFINGAKWADKTMLEKVCQWLDCNVDDYLFVDVEGLAGIRWDEFINDFKKAMQVEL